MKRTSSVILPVLAFFVFLIACTRIDTTELGDELIPAVDNVNTFDLTLEVESDNILFTDTLETIASDDLPIGEIFNDPEFGQTVSNLFFTIYPPGAARPSYPFYNKDSVKGIDSVVLQLAFKGVYGDTTSVQTFTVEEISQASSFKDSAYTIGAGSFPTSGVLGSKVVDFTKLNDSIKLTRKGTTETVVNVLRIPLNNSLGTRFVNYDTTSTANGAYKFDDVFSTLFRGIAIKVDSNKPTNRALAYFNLSDAGTKLQVYYRVQRNGVIDTTVAEFVHSGRDTIPGGLFVSRAGRASTIRRNAQHGYATYLTNGTAKDDRLYIQTTPGSYALLKIPGLDTVANKVIHRAELIVPRLATASEATYGLPQLLFLDMITDDKDSAYTIQNDFVIGNGGANFTVFGGALRKSDETYRFNISRHVQGIITRNETNYDFRLYAPYITAPFYVPPGKASDYNFATFILPPDIPIIGQIARGRVVLHGGNAGDPSKRLRLYIIYSKI